MNAALAMAKGPAGVRSACGTDKATVAVPEALGPGAYGRAGGGADAKGHHIVRPCMGPRHCGERVGEHLLSWKERDIARGNEMGPAERDLSGHGKYVTG